MPDTKPTGNPFIVTTPEDMSATEAYNLFVDVFTDFPKILDEGHTFLHGPRGSGKSMMFRFLMPDCQKLKYNCFVNNLPFYSIYIRIKNAELHITELERLEGKHAAYILNEHFMIMHISEIVFDALLKEACIDNDSDVNIESINEFFNNSFLRYLRNCGFKNCESGEYTFRSVSEGLQKMYDICEHIYSQVKNYFKRLSFHDSIIPYTEPVLCSYLDFLLPLLKGLRRLPFMPDGPIYLLVDDADNLSRTQTKILNSWVFTRSSSDVSIKISTQLQYETYQTVTGKIIETPHDYSEVNISTVYTASGKNRYMDRVKRIVIKRLKLHGIDDVSPEQFFPVNEKQETEIKAIGDKIREKWSEGEGKGYRASDDVVRYARPDYIKKLSGLSKSSPTYSYAGFEQQVHLSSGIVRYFLDAAKQMFNEVVSSKKFTDIKYIPDGIQNKVLRDKANEFLFDELIKKNDDQSKTESDQKITKLINLILALGGLFRKCLLSDRSERKVFSFAFSNPPPDSLMEIIHFGVKCGYFQTSTIGKKDSQSGGRTRLYILSRRLAPIFTLDPTGFAGYLFMEGEFLAKAMKNPDAILRRIKDANDISNTLQPKQLKLFN